MGASIASKGVEMTKERRRELDGINARLKGSDRVLVPYGRTLMERHWWLVLPGDKYKVADDDEWRNKSGKDYFG